MKNKNCLLFLFFVCVCTTLSFSQKKSIKYWDLALGNNNKEALTYFLNNNKESYKNSIEMLLSHEILRNENGFINGASRGFLKNLMKFSDFEYYLYALWNKPFLFDNYLKTSFYNKNSEAISRVDISKVNNKTIEYSLRYLKAILERDNKNFKKYDSYISGIPTIKDWQFCGVFENLNKSGFDKKYEPEAYAKSDKMFNANSNGLTSWYTPHKDYTKESYQFFVNHSEYGYGVHYAQTFIKSDKDRRVQLRLGNSSAFKVWLNDVLIYENTKDIGTDIDAYKVTINLSKGNNRLLIKNAESNGTPYFIARISDEKGLPISELKYSSNYSKYKKGTITSVNPQKNANEIELFFRDKIKNEPNNFFYKYCLINTYLRNQNYEKANSILNPLFKKYKKSSLLRLFKTYTYSYEGDFKSVKEVNKNIYLDDPDYYYSIVKKATDINNLNRMDVKELENFVNKLGSSTDYPVLKLMGQFVIDARNEDMTALRKTMDDLFENVSDRVVLLKNFIPIYDNVFKDQERTIKEYENLLKKKFSPAIVNGLSVYYNKLNRKKDVINLYKEYSQNFPSENEFLFSLIKKLHSYKMYAESNKYIDLALKNFPYSFKAMEYKGNALVQLGNKKEAIRFYEKSLVYNNGNKSLIKKIETLSRKANIIDTYIEKDIYAYVDQERNKNKKNNYGVNILLDNRVVQLYKSGSLKNRNIILYEITSKNGVKNYKEYDLGLSGSYTILKSEIIKKDKSIVPADKSKSKFVFNSLEVGDVIHLSYETTSTGSGRFYKDFVDSYQFDSENYCLKTKYTLISPKDKYLKFTVANGDLPYNKSKNGDYIVHDWELLNAKELPKSEDYMPSNYDFARILHVSTIKSWNDIANWYSDLVRSQSVFNEEVEKVYYEIFSEKDVRKLSEEERVRRIYYYIMNNFNYSYVNFKQSGFIPQKPAQIISSRLGDCKDFSTLFATFARRAGLDVNLVLILTSDFGKKSLMLPAQDFNHCIVKVKINGEDQFLELTDKNLPFKSIPNGLLNATGLEIPYLSDTNREYELFHLENLKGVVAKMEAKVSIVIDKNDSQKIKIDSKISGGLASSYFDVLNQDSYELIKKSIKGDFIDRIGNGVVLDSVTNIDARIGKEYLSYSSELHIDNKMNEMGSMKFFKLPIVSHAYNQSIVDLEKRNYSIIYQNYENSNFYSTTYEVEVPKGKKIIEVPKDKELSYKDHQYKVTFKSVNDRKLVVKIEAKTSLKDVSKDEYLEFKKYITQILKTKDILIGFK